MRSAWIVVCALMASACVDSQRTVLNTSPNFAALDWSKGDGPNTVTGSAVQRTAGGEARTCAGLPVRLSPDSAYARDRLKIIYGSLVKGTRPADGRTKFSTDDPAYKSVIRETHCDGQGGFVFDKVPDGTWYVATGVMGKANPGAPVTDGGIMMQRVELSGGQTVKVTLP